MLTAAQAAVLNNKLALQLKSVGEMECPPSTNNAESYAWDYYVANKIEAYGKKAKDAARKAAIKNGVMFDHEKEPLEPGSQQDVYSGDVIRISVAVKQPITKVDGEEFYEALKKIGLVDEKVEKLFLAAHRTSRPAHTFTATLLSD